MFGGFCSHKTSENSREKQKRFLVQCISTLSSGKSNIYAAMSMMIGTINTTSNIYAH